MLHQTVPEGREDLIMAVGRDDSSLEQLLVDRIQYLTSSRSVVYGQRRGLSGPGRSRCGDRPGRVFPPYYGDYADWWHRFTYKNSPINDPTGPPEQSEKGDMRRIIRAGSLTGEFL